MPATADLSESQTLPPIVLLLDDERDILEMYTAHFQAEGVWVATAASANEGLMAVQDLRPDLVVTDIGFGREPSGATFAKTLKDTPETCVIPLIVLTGLPNEDLPPSVRHDADLLLRKPVAPAALLQDVRRLLGSSRTVEACAARVQAVSDVVARREPFHAITNRDGDVLSVDRATAEYLNLSWQHFLGRNLLFFVTEGRLQIASDLRQVASIEFPTRDAVFRPRERAPRRAAVSVCETEGRIRWTFQDLGPAKVGRA